jgi:hypothetical protein
MKTVQENVTTRKNHEEKTKPLFYCMLNNRLVVSGWFYLLLHYVTVAIGVVTTVLFSVTIMSLVMIVNCFCCWYCYLTSFSSCSVIIIDIFLVQKALLFSFCDIGCCNCHCENKHFCLLTSMLV